MTNPLNGKHILLGITGSVAAYKAVDLASKLTQSGSKVDVILTNSALQFVKPLSYQSVTGQRAYTDDDLWGGEAHVIHVGIGHSIDMLVIAPCSANTIAKLAHGLSDNLLTVTALAAGGRESRLCPILIAPAMDGGMYAHPATQANLDILRQRGIEILGPAEGHLASGFIGPGRMVEPLELLGHIRFILSKNGPLKGRKVVVTAGGTQEPIDPVRAITNRSSGKQGFALAQTALDMGADVTLIAGPTNLPTPVGAHRIDVNTAAEMYNLVMTWTSSADILCMAAAVADFRPIISAQDKIKKESGVPDIKLELTQDILAAVTREKSVCGYPLVVVGFAAESRDLLCNAKAKIQSKNLDLIVANDISAVDAGFGVDYNRVILVDNTEIQETLPLMSKTDVAERILERIIKILTEKGL